MEDSFSTNWGGRGGGGTGGGAEAIMGEASTDQEEEVGDPLQQMTELINC